MAPRQTTPDAATRLWTEIEAVNANLALNRRLIGSLFLQLRNLYSERARSEPPGRLSSGHGTFEVEIKKRGFRPNRVREWINDYEVAKGLRPASESTAAKRKARRDSSAEYRRGLRDGQNFAQLDDVASDPWAGFARLLSHAEARTAFRSAAMRLHPDHAGDSDLMARLNQLWAQLEPLYVAKEAAGCVPDSDGSSKRTIQ
jgi:hypothetical protein